MKTSRDYNELKHFWTEWHNKGTENMKELYQRFVELSNKASHLNGRFPSFLFHLLLKDRWSLFCIGFSDTGAYWLHIYEREAFKDDIESLWQQMKPFYAQIHAYVRSKLRSSYGAEHFGEDGLIPAHLLGK